MNQQTELMSPKDAADYLTVSVRSLEQWRQKSRGPKYVKIQGSIRYRKSDLDEFMVVVEPDNK